MEPFANPSPEEITELLRRARRIAVVGCSTDRSRPSHSITRYLIDAGYDVAPVNPQHDSVFERTCHADLHAAKAAAGDIDLVDVFRRSDFAGTHVDEAIAIGAKAVWLQDGVIDYAAALRARNAGLTVVMDRCIYRDHVRLIGRPESPSSSPQR